MEPTWAEIITLAILCIAGGAWALWLVYQVETHY